MRKPGGLKEERRHAVVRFDSETVFNAFRTVPQERIFAGQIVVAPEGEERFQPEHTALTPLDVVTDQDNSLPAGHQDRFFNHRPSCPIDKAGIQVQREFLQNRRTGGKENAGIAVGTEEKLLPVRGEGVFQFG